MPALDLNEVPAVDGAEARLAGLPGGYRVAADEALPGIAGLACCAAYDPSRRRTALVAVQSLPHLPPRALSLGLLQANPVEGVMCPLGSGAASAADGLPALFTVYPAPAGPPLWPAGQAGSAEAAPWGEHALLTRVLRPAAATLERLQALGLTHRAIRPDNMYLNRHGDAVVLGPGWSAPPGCFQPVLFEPHYSGMCHPAARGEGGIADDVYALGVTLLLLALGHDPLAGMDDDAILRRKADMGSFAALAGDVRLPSMLADLLRGMLADDPDHRPPPALLADPAAARGRRVAARPMRRAQRSLDLGGRPIWTARGLAFAMTRDPDAALRLLRDGSIDRWVRRGLGDPAVAVRLEEAMRRRAGDLDDEQRADGLLLMRAVGLMDPLAPLCWRGLALWPDGLGALLAATASEPADRQAIRRDLIESEAQMAWAAMRGDDGSGGVTARGAGDAAPVRMESHRQMMWLRQRGWGGGLPRLRYALNPMLACASPALAGELVIRLEQLLPALDRAAARQDAAGGQAGGANAPGNFPIDPQIGAFMAARHEQRIDGDLLAIMDAKTPFAAALVQLRLLAWLQHRLRQAAVPALAGWLAARVAPRLDALQKATRREAAVARLRAAAAAGDLVAMQGLMEDPDGAAQDLREAASARLQVQQIDAELARMASLASHRGALARRWAHDASLSLGMVLLALLVCVAVLG